MATISKFDKFADNIFSVKLFETTLSTDNSERYKRNIHTLENIINNELTEKQKNCLIMYYKHNMNTIEISKKLNIYPSTAWRHITKAKNKINTILKYLIINTKIGGQNHQS